MGSLPIGLRQTLAIHVVHPSWPIIPRYLVCCDVVPPRFPATHCWHVITLTSTLRDVVQSIHTSVIMIVDEAIQHPRSGIQCLHSCRHESCWKKRSYILAMTIDNERLSVKVSCICEKIINIKQEPGTSTVAL